MGSNERRRKRQLLAAIALLDEAIVIFLVIGGAAYLSVRLGVLSPVEAALLAAPLALAMAIAVAKAVEAAGLEPRIGREALIGREARVVEARGSTLLVELDGELWSAEPVRGGVEPGSRVRVVGVKGIKLLVEPIDRDESPR